MYDDLWRRLDETSFAFALAESERYFHLDPVLVRGKRCLDAGCGVGFFVTRLCRAGAAHVEAIDIGEENCRNTAHWNRAFGDRVTVRRMSVLSLAYPDASFEFTHSNGVLHHTEHPFEGFQELCRVTAPGGTVVVGLYGAGGLFPLAVRALRRMVRRMPYPAVSRVVSWLFRKPYDQYLILDFLFVPIQRRYRASEVRTWFNTMGCTDVVRYATHSRYRPGSAWARLLHGEGYLTMSGRIAAGSS